MDRCCIVLRRYHGPEVHAQDAAAARRCGRHATCLDLFVVNHSETRMNSKTRGKAPEENRDPITGAPGAHPVGTGVGAVLGGAAAGAAAGTAAAGPVGTLVGTAVGAVAGGLAG